MAKNRKLVDTYSLHAAFRRLVVDVNCSDTTCKECEAEQSSVSTTTNTTCNHQHTERRKPTQIPKPCWSSLRSPALPSERKLIRESKLKLLNPIKTRKSTHFSPNRKSCSSLPIWPKSSTNAITQSRVSSAKSEAIFGDASSLKPSTYAAISNSMPRNRKMPKRSRSLPVFTDDDDTVGEPVTIPSQSDNLRPDRTCSQEAHMESDDCSLTDLAAYFEDCVHIPKKMSVMAEMMYL